MSNTPKKKSSAKARNAASVAQRKEGFAAAVSSEIRLSEDERRSMIAEAAYYRAERRGFCAGHEVEDWLEAEREITQRFEAISALGDSPEAIGASARPKQKERPSKRA